MNNLFIAMVAHEVNRAYCLSIGDTSQPVWADAPDWQKSSALAGVAAHLASPQLTPEESHALWMAAKEADGWTFGPIKDVEKKQHPCMVPYDQLPPAQRTKDYLFKGVVAALAGVPADQLPGPQPTAQAPLLTVKGFTPITYIGRRETYRDAAYSGLVFTKGQTQLVPTPKAILMLRHPDVYKQGEVAAAAEPAPEAAAAPAQPPKPQETELETEEMESAARNLATMNRKGMAEFARINFNVELDPEKMQAAEMRAKVKQLIDQFGLPGQAGSVKK